MLCRTKTFIILAAFTAAFSFATVDVSAQNICSGNFAAEYERFRCLLKERTSAMIAGQSARVDIIDNILDTRYKKRRSVFILDLTGFTSATIDYGIIPTMAGIQEVWDRIKPVVQAKGGVVLKDEADTIYALFPDVPKAVGAAIGSQDAVAKLNAQILTTRGLDKLRYCTSIGIGWGDVYLIGNDDAFGLEVTFAYDAGEVKAGPSQILLTKSATDEISGNLPAGVKGLRQWDILNESGGMSRLSYSFWEVRRDSPVICIPR